MELIKKTVLSCTTHRGLSMHTLSSIQACPWMGVSMTQGITDVALARNKQIGEAMGAAQHYGAEFILMVDDDMQFTSDVAEKVLQHARTLRHAVSARYMTGNLHKPALACAPMGNGRFMTGLGFLAIPVELMAQRLERAPIAYWGEEPIRVVTACGPAGTVEKQIWVSEDYEFTMGLGGVYMSEEEVGHIKPTILLPSSFKLALPEPVKPAPATSEAQPAPAPAAAPSAPTAPSAPADTETAPRTS